MFNLANWKILYKLLLLVATMSVVIAVVAGTGLFSLRDTVATTKEVADNGKFALNGARMNQNILYLTRSEFRLASDPSPESLKTVLPIIEENRKALTDRLEQSRAGASPEELAKIDLIEAKLADYLPRLEQTLELGAHGPRRLHVVLVEDADEAAA